MSSKALNRTSHASTFLKPRNFIVSTGLKRRLIVNFRYPPRRWHRSPLFSVGCHRQVLINKRPSAIRSYQPFFFNLVFGALIASLYLPNCKLQLSFIGTNDCSVLDTCILSDFTSPSQIYKSLLVMLNSFFVPHFVIFKGCLHFVNLELERVKKLRVLLFLQKDTMIHLDTSFNIREVGR